MALNPVNAPRLAGKYIFNGEVNMSKQEIYQEMKETLGLVPKFFQHVPENTLESEWNLFKQIQLEEGHIPNKYRELIGLGISAVTKCYYCAFYHTEAAKLFGATDEEIEEAVHYAKSSAGWSAYLNGLQFDLNEFRNEVRQIVRHVQSLQETTA